MHPISHVGLTLLASIPLVIKTENPQIMVLALGLTLSIDIFDHAAYLAFSKGPFARAARDHLKRKDILRGCKYYYSNRKDEIDFLLLHNLFSFVLIIIFTALLLNFSSIVFYILLLGIVFHLVCDLFEDIVLKKNEYFWYNGWRIFLKTLFST